MDNNGGWLDSNFFSILYFFSFVWFSAPDYESRLFEASYGSIHFSVTFTNYLYITYPGENGTESWLGALLYIDHDTTLACMDGGMDGIAFRCAWRDIYLVYYVGLFSLLNHPSLRVDRRDGWSFTSLLFCPDGIYTTLLVISRYFGKSWEIDGVFAWHFYRRHGIISAPWFDIFRIRMVCVASYIY